MKRVASVAAAARGLGSILRGFAAAALLAAAPMVAAQPSIQFNVNSPFFMSGGTEFEVELWTRDATKQPAGGGGLSWFFDSKCLALSGFSVPSTADGSGTTPATIFAGPASGTCTITVEWDDDGDDQTAPFAAQLEVEVFGAPPSYSITPISAPNSPHPSFLNPQVTILVTEEGFPAKGLTISWEVEIDTGIVGKPFIQQYCKEVPPTDSSGQATLDFSAAGVPIDSDAIGYTVRAAVADFQFCYVFPEDYVEVALFTIEEATVEFENPPDSFPGIPIDQPTTFTLLLQTSSGQPLAGYAFAWTVSGVDVSPGNKGSTLPTDGSGRTTITFTPLEMGSEVALRADLQGTDFDFPPAFAFFNTFASPPQLSPVIVPPTVIPAFIGSTSITISATQDGKPADDVGIYWLVDEPKGGPREYGDFCDPEQFTNKQGEATFEIPLNGLSGTYTVFAGASDPNMCRGTGRAAATHANRPKGGAPDGMELVATFGVEFAELVYEGEPFQFPAGQPASIGLRFQTTPSEVGIPGYEFDWFMDCTNVAPNPGKGTTLATDSGGRTSIDFTPGSPGSGCVNAYDVSNKLGVDVSTEFVVFERSLQVVDPPPSQTYTDEIGAAFSVQTLLDFGGQFAEPEGGVPVTFTITSGNAVFTANQSTVYETTSSVGAPRGAGVKGSSGIAASSPVLVGRTANPVSITVSAPGSDPLFATYTTIASSYSLQAVSPTKLGIADNQTVDLTARVLREGSSTPEPLGPGDTVTWTIEPPANGAAVTPATPTDSGGNATATFDPVAEGTYTVVAQFDPGIASASTVAFTIDVAGTGPVASLVPFSGDLTTGPPGFQFQISARYLEDGLPVSPSPARTVLWAVSGGDAQVSPDSSLAGAPNGIASTTVTFGVEPGPVIVSAQLEDDPDVSTFFFLEIREQVQLLVLEPDGGQLEVPPNTPFDVVARLLNVQGQPLPERFIEVISDIPDLPSGLLTLSDGTASFSAVAPATDGSYTIELRFAESSLREREKAIGVPPISEFVTINVRSDDGGGTALLVPVEGDGQRGVIGFAAAPLRVRYTEDDLPVEGVPILWEVAGGGSPSSQTVATNSQGIATFNYTFGTTPGPVVVTASTDGGQLSAQFQLTAVLAELGIVSGNGQRGPVQTEADFPLTIQLTDGAGTPLSNQTIQWNVTGGDAVLLAGGNGNSAQSITDSIGRASIGFRYGNSPGPVSIQASSELVAAPVVFAALAEVPGLRIASGDGQVGEAGEPLAEDLVISIAPELAKALGGVTVVWETLSGGGSIASATTTTDASGLSRNQLRLGQAPGVNVVRASIGIADGPSVTFSAEGIISAVDLVKVSGDNQSALPTNSDSAPLVVRVTRAVNGEPLAGATIVWSGENAGFVLPGSADLASQTTSTTDAQGEARIVARVIASGPATVSAGLDGSALDPLVFVLEGAIANTERLNSNERDLAEVFDAACIALADLPNRTPAQEDLYQRCLELQRSSGENPDDVGDALNELAPDVGFTMTGAGLEVITTQIANVNGYLVEARNNPAGRGQFKVALATPTGALPLSFLPSAVLAAESAEGQDLGPDFGRWGFFASGTIGRGKYRSGQRVPDYDYNSGNLTFGADYRLTDAFILGAGLGYSRHDTDLRNDRGSLEASGWNLIGYGTWYNERQWFVDGVLSLGRNTYDLTRKLDYRIGATDGGITTINQVATASTKGDQLGLSLSVGRDWQKGPWNINSYLRGNYLRTQYDAYEEQMIAGLPGSGLALGVEARDLKNTTSTVGGKATYILSRDWGILMPHAQVEWEHSFESDPSQLFSRFLADPTGTRFIQVGDDVDTDYFNVGVGISALWPGGRSAYLSYERLMGASRLTQDTLSLGIRIEF